MVGLTLRKRRVFRHADNRILLVPMDHGITLGKVQGLEDIRAAVKTVADAGADGVVLHKGMARFVADMLPSTCNLFIHVSASTTLGTHAGHKVGVCSVEEAIQLGADGVSAHINVGDDSEPEQLEALGRLSDACRRWGMPLLVMAYPRGPRVSDEHAPPAVAHAVRIAAELGADLIKTNYTGNPDTFRYAIQGCPVPTLIAGGPFRPDGLVDMVKDALLAGAAGVSIGRSIFGQRDAAGTIQSLVRVIHGRESGR